MDVSDQAIIEVLKQDARMSIRDVARQTSLRPSTVHQRIAKMRGSGLIKKFTVKLDNSKADQGFIAFILMSTRKDLDRKFLDDPHVCEVFGITGEYDLLVKLKFADVAQFNDFILDLRKDGNVKKSVSLIATVNLKEEL